MLERIKISVTACSCLFLLLGLAFIGGLTTQNSLATVITTNEISSDFELTGNITDERFVIISNNVEFDCDGYEIHSYGVDYPAITVAEGVRNAEIRNCYISGFDTGIYFEGNNRRGTVEDNVITDFYHSGIELDEGCNQINVLNNFLNAGDEEEFCSSTETSSSRTLAFVEGGYPVGIALYDTQRTNIDFNYLANNNVGILVYGSNRNNVRSNNVVGSCYTGIDVAGGEGDPSESNKVLDNIVVANNYYGINLYDANDNTVEGNVLYNNGMDFDFLQYKLPVWEDIFNDCDPTYGTCRGETSLCLNGKEDISCVNFPPAPLFFCLIQLFFWEEGPIGPIPVGEGALTALNIYESDDNEINENVVARNCGIAIGVSGSEGNKLEANEVASNTAGIGLYEVDGTDVDGNQVYANFLSGIFFEHTFDSDIDSNNVYANGIIFDFRGIGAIGAASSTPVIEPEISELIFESFIGGIVQADFFYGGGSSSGVKVTRNKAKVNTPCDIFVHPGDNQVANNHTLIEQEECTFNIPD